MPDQLLRRLQRTVELRFVGEFQNLFADVLGAGGGLDVIAEKFSERRQVLFFMAREHIGALKGEIDPGGRCVRLRLGENFLFPDDRRFVVDQQFRVAADVFHDGAIYHQFFTGFEIKF